MIFFVAGSIRMIRTGVSSGTPVTNAVRFFSRRTFL